MLPIFFIDELQAVSRRPSGLDPAVLLGMQRSLVEQVMQLYRMEYRAFDQDLAARPLSDDQRRDERRAFIEALVQSEYRQRASNGQGFSMPAYTEFATNKYLMDIQRLARSIQDYSVVAKQTAELHYTQTPRENRRAEPDAGQLAHKVAHQIDSLEVAIAGLATVAKSQTPVTALKAALTDVFNEAKSDRFTESILEEARTLAAATQYERKHGLNDIKGMSLHA